VAALIVVVLLGVVIAWVGCITASWGRTHLRRPELAWSRRGAVVALSVPVALHLHALTAVWYVSTTTYDDADHGHTVVTSGTSSGLAQLITLAVVASAVLSALSVYGRRDWSPLSLACAWLLLAPPRDGSRSEVEVPGGPAGTTGTPSPNLAVGRNRIRLPLRASRSVSRPTGRSAPRRRT